MTAETRWRSAVFERDADETGTPICRADRHAFQCRGIPHHAHHIVYRSQILTSQYWTILANGIALSYACHDLAHATHNANLPPQRVADAKRAVSLNQ